jgi:hypothetical protein
VQFFSFRPTGTTKTFHITYKQIVSAMNKIARRGPKRATGWKYAVMNPRTGDSFSPKEVLRLIIGDRYSFYGGKGAKGANQVFRTFGFPVGNLAKLREHRDNLLRRKSRIPTVNNLQYRLFS